MTDKIKVEKDETIDEQPLPELTPWQSILDRPTGLKDLNITDYNKLISAENDIKSIEEWQGYLDNILSVQTAEIIAEWSFKDSGALAIKQDANNGLWLSPTGILAKKAGNTTFSITSGGDATFGGSLLAGISITSPIITGGTITGSKVRTSATGKRVEMITDPGDYQNYLAVYDDSGMSIVMGEDYLHWIYGGFHITSGGESTMNIAFTFPSADQGLFQITKYTGGLIRLAASTRLELEDAYSHGHFFPTSHNSYNLGSSLNKWKNIYLSGDIIIDGTVDGVDIYSHTTNASAHHSRYTNSEAVSAITGNTIYPSNVDISSNGYIKRNGTNHIQLTSLGFDMYVPLGLRQLSSPPGAASTYKGFLYFDTTQTTMVFSNGSGWYKVTAEAI